MNENDYLRIQKQLMDFCKSDIVRVFDDAFLKRWKKYMWEERGKLMAEAFVIPLFACWVLWYVFGDLPQNHRLLEFSNVAILLCASLHYTLTVGRCKKWVLSEFLDSDTEAAVERCMVECKEKMLAEVNTEEETKMISDFFEIAAHDSHIGVSMHRVWFGNSRKMK